MRLSGWCVLKNDSQMPNISGELLFESNKRISFIFGKMCRTFKLHKCKPFDEKVKISHSSDVSSIAERDSPLTNELELSLSESLRSSLSGTSGMVWSMEER